MSTSLNRLCGALTVAALPVIGLAAAGPAQAATTPPWEVGNPNAVGTITFYDANGNVVTSGKSDAGPFAAYAVGSATVRAGDVTAGLQYAGPDPNKTPALFPKQQVGNYTTYPVTSASAPANIKSAKTPVNTGASDDATLDDFYNNLSDPSSDPDYAGIIQIRLRTANTGGQSTTPYDTADLKVNTSTHTWTQVYPAPAAATKPGAPTNVSATAGDASATVNFTAPTDNGGATITGYKVEYAVSGTTTFTTATTTATASPYTVTGLKNGTSYVFRVSATNSAGTGTASANSAAVTPTAAKTAPGAPTNVSATAGNAQATVTWTAPASTGGSPITGYKVEYAVSGTTSFTTFPTSGTGTTATVTGLMNGTSYVFRVSAINAVDTSSPSANSAAVTPKAPVAPAAPTNVSAVAGDTKATVTWTAPTDNGGSAITGYTVEQSTDGTTYTTSTTSAPLSASSTSATVTGLTDGTPYQFRVRAINAVGPGTASAPSAAVTPKMISAPASPTNVTAFGGNARATVTWTAPTDNGGSAITGYLVEQSTDGKAFTTSTTTTDTTKSTATTATVTGLTNGTAYQFRVSAINAVGTSLPSTPSGAITPLQPISTPSELEISAPAEVPFGSKAVIGVSLSDSESQTALGGRTVSLYGRHAANQDFGRILSINTTSKGTAAVAVTPGSYEQWEWRYAGDDQHDATTSAVAITDVRQLLTVARTASTVKPGQVIVVYGQVAPYVANEGIYLQRLNGSTWTNVVYGLVKSQTLPDGKTSGYQLGIRLNTAGSAQYRIYKPASDGRLSATSGSFTLAAK